MDKNANPMLGVFARSKKNRDVELGKVPAPSEAKSAADPPVQAPESAAEPPEMLQKPAPHGKPPAAKPEETREAVPQGGPASAPAQQHSPKHAAEARRGRPPVSVKTSKFTLAIEPELKEEFKRVCAIHHLLPSDVIQECIRTFLSQNSEDG